jgi:hypothetical protein
VDVPFVEMRMLYISVMSDIWMRVLMLVEREG